MKLREDSSKVLSSNSYLSSNLSSYKITNKDKLVSVTKFFSINDAINSDMDSNNPFIIANETTTSTGHIGRYYTVLPNFKTFVVNRTKFPHCHEILVNHKNSKPDLAGRLVFDFDLKLSEQEIPSDFKRQIENTIVKVIETYFANVDIEKLEYIWSTSQNPLKFSKHLTVKNLYFNNWISLSKIFYKLFCIIWDNDYMWINSNKLIDFQIVRKHASLRMVGSSKIGGAILTFDDNSHTLTDSLIRIYSNNHKKEEQLVTIDNVIPSVFDNVIENESFDTNQNIENIYYCLKNSKLEKPCYDSIVYEKAFEIYKSIHPNIFKMGKINGSILSLIRKKPGTCLLSGKLHENENSFIAIQKKDDSYSVRFGCHRFCYSNRTIYIGSITMDNYMILVNSDLKNRLKTVKKNTKKVISRSLWV